MIYYKPKDVRFVDMAIWIDQHAYEPDCDQELLFKYLYLLIHMLAEVGKYFRNTRDLEDFSIYTATQIYLRYHNEKQYQYDTDGNPKLQKIKSSLNYLRSTLYGHKVDYQNETFVQCSDKPEQPDEDDGYDSADNPKYSFSAYFDANTNDLAYIDFMIYLEDIAGTMLSIMETTPYNQQSSEFLNLYTSCLLTLRQQLTIKNHDKVRTEKLNSEYLRDKSYRVLFNKQEAADPVLFDVPQELSDYVKLLVRKCRIAMRRDITSILNSDINFSDVAIDWYETVTGKDEDSDG